jgi:hypothetical protein
MGGLGHHHKTSSSHVAVRRHSALMQLVVFITGILHATLSAHAGTFTVTNAAPSGVGSLTASVALALGNASCQLAAVCHSPL